MMVRKFQGSSMREALAQVKRELGPDALILATREFGGGMRTEFEVTASLTAGPDGDGDSEAAHDRRTPAAAYGPRARRPKEPPRPAAAAMTDEDVERIMAPLRSELRVIRTLLKDVRPDQGIKRELVAMRQALRDAAVSGNPSALEEPLGEIATRANIVAPSVRRVVALVGPTGVGKTTTIAKQAAREALVERRKVALVTLDTFRVGGEDQIRAYADLIGVPLSVVHDPDRLPETVAQLTKFDRIFIDSAGRSPFDRAALGQLRRALAGVADLEVHLTLSSGSTAAQIDRAFERYRPGRVDRLLFTKLDEADSLEELVRAPARLGTPVTWVTTGQRVPEDIEEANVVGLLRIAQGGFGRAEAAA